MWHIVPNRLVDVNSICLFESMKKGMIFHAFLTLTDCNQIVIARTPIPWRCALFNGIETGRRKINRWSQICMLAHGLAMPATPAARRCRWLHPLCRGTARRAQPTMPAPNQRDRLSEGCGGYTAVCWARRAVPLPQSRCCRGHDRANRPCNQSGVWHTIGHLGLPGACNAASAMEPDVISTEIGKHKASF